MTVTGITWWQDDPDLLESELTEAAAQFPDLLWVEDGAGQLRGPIPSWPFEREPPGDVSILFGNEPLQIQVCYSQAHPAVPPSIRPINVAVPAQLRTVTAYHVLADGNLCLLQSASQWTTSSKTAELILKAAGWRIEYELFGRGLLTGPFTENGIVGDTIHDVLIRDAIALVQRG